MVAQPLPVPSRFPFHPDETQSPGITLGWCWQVPVACGQCQTEDTCRTGATSFARPGKPVFQVKYPYCVKKEDLTLSTPQQSPQMSPRAVWLQVGVGEGWEGLEEDKALSGCTLVSGTWKKCGGV